MLWSTSAVLALLGSVAALPQPRALGKSKSDFAVTRDFPGVPFQIPQSYAGLLPISKSASESRELFFWYYPTTGDVGENDLVIWLNGGPGCSSLEGLLQENGPWLLPWNSDKVVENPYSWTNLSNVLWVEQPVGTGFTSGVPDVRNETQVAKEFTGFLENFFEVFSELKGKYLWITGESYAGFYIPYIANEIYSLPEAECKAAGFNLKGTSLNDPSFTKDERGFGEDIPSVDFAVEYSELLGLNQSFLDSFIQAGKENGIYNYTATHLSYPPNGHLYLPEAFGANYTPFNDLYAAAVEANPCFDIYDIRLKCPSVTDRLGFAPDALYPSSTNFLNNQSGVKEALHVSSDKVWYECSNINVFVNGTDNSPRPDVSVLPGVIEKSTRTMISHGLLDMVLIWQGSILAINNMTWGGEQGFQEAPSTKFYVDGKEAGTTHTERKLTWTLVERAGHMIPQDYPQASYKMLQFLLGQIDSL